LVLQGLAGAGGGLVFHFMTLKKHAS